MSAIIVDVVSALERREPVSSGVPSRRIPTECREFVERTVNNTRTVVARTGSGEAPEVDWEAIWSAGDGAASEEQAVGRIVAAAFVVARDLLRSSENSAGRAVGNHREPAPAPYHPPVVAATPVPRPIAPPRAAPPAPTLPPAGPVPSPLRPVEPRPLLTAADRSVTVPSLHGIPEAQTVRPPQDAAIDSLPSDLPIQRMSTSLLGWSTFYTWMRNVGIVVVLFVAWQLWGTSISQHHEQHQLQNAFEASVRAHHVKASTSHGPVLASATAVVPTPPEGTVVAKLQIPSIDLSEYVVSGTAEGDLAKGPGHYVGSAAPGQAGNVAIAGHRTTNGAPFNRLGQIAIGNDIYLTTTSGERLTYVVSETPQAVSPGDVAVLDNFGDNRITLTTCNPEFSSSQRLIVVGELKQPTPPVAVKTKPHAYHIVNAQTASWDWSLLPVVVLEAGVLLLLGLTNRRFAAWFGRSSRWFILVPIWGAGLYLLFSTLTTFLPATI
jgi:LPXTG-site transpeptidase (sortase) family protein